jgi:hypothetical protein
LSKKGKKRGANSFGRARSINDYHRRPGHKSPEKVIVIVCEGEQTEPNYFRALRQKFRLSNVNVQVVPGKGAPINVVKCAIDEKKKLDEPTDEVWCVLDTENPINNATLIVAIEKAKKNQINLAISNPSFEYWYFIHFEDSSRPFANGQDMKRALKTHIPNYDEKMSIFPTLDSLTSIAMGNAEKLRRRSPESWDVFPNPSTGIDKLVQEILAMGQTRKY